MVFLIINNVKLKYFKILILLFVSSSCNTYLTGDKDLGNGYILTNDRSFSTILRTSQRPYKGVGIELIPPTVIKVNYNDSLIIAYSIDKTTKNNHYWIIDKTSGIDMKLLRTDTIDWDSVKWLNVDGPLDSTSFYQLLEERRIDLSFNN